MVNTCVSTALWQIKMLQRDFLLDMLFAAKILNHFHILWYIEVILHRAPSQYFTGLGWINTDSRHFTFRKINMCSKKKKKKKKKTISFFSCIKGLVLTCLISWHQSQHVRYKSVAQSVLMQPLFLSCSGSNVIFLHTISELCRSPCNCHVPDSRQLCRWLF